VRRLTTDLLGSRWLVRGVTPGRLSGPLVLLALAFSLASAPSSLAVLAPKLTMFASGITPESDPSGITEGPERNLWFTESNAAAIGRITPTGVVTEFSTGITPRSAPKAIVSGFDGNLWFTETCANKIGRITPTGNITEFTLPVPGAPQIAGCIAESFSQSISAGPDGNLWFTRAAEIGRITPAGLVTLFTIPQAPESGPEAQGITAGPDGNLWYTVSGYSHGQPFGRIGRISPTGFITEFSSGLTQFPRAISQGPEGNLWFTEGNGIGRVTTSGVITEFNSSLLTEVPGSGFITPGADGNLWFTTASGAVAGGNAFGQITPSGAITTMDGFPNSEQLNIAFGGGTQAPDVITAGPDGNLWFTNPPDRIGRISNLQAQPPSPVLADITKVNVANGILAVSWKRTHARPPAPITSYAVTATPSGNDRVPAPAVRLVSVSDRKTRLSASLRGLLQDCHQVYKVGVTPIMGHTRGATAFWPLSVRPSGVVSRVPPAEVVVLLDGINESKPGFQMNPYKPTLDGAPSYCPEAWSPTRLVDGLHWSESDFAGAPKGPWSFFDKWNFDDQTSEGSTPRDLSTGAPTHSFMLDAIAAHGAVILPYSYSGASLEKPNRAHPDPRFVYNKYGSDTSTPGRPGSATLDSDVQTLQDEIASIHKVWPQTKIVVVGHSQGGLIAFRWWQKWWLKSGVNFRRASGQTGVYRLFSLDSPINGVCASAVCVGPPGYPSYGLRQALDPLALTLDERSGNAFRFLGTVGDTVPTPIGNSYGPSGNENLQHQLLFDYSHCSDSSGVTCPAPAPPDHISDCPITPQSPSWEQQSQHFVVKFCPGNVTYFNKTLGLSY